MKGGDRNSANKNRKHSSKTVPRKNEELRLQKAREILQDIEKYNLTLEDLARLAEEELQVPTSIFNKQLTVLESVVKYLHEEKNFSLAQIAKTINRDERNIWHIREKAKHKSPKRFLVPTKYLRVPVSVFSKKKLSAQESLVSFLRDEEHRSYIEIAQILHRSASTVRTVYQRARRKYVS